MNKEILEALSAEELQEYKEYVKENTEKSDVFLLSCFLQNKKIKVPDITPTNFGVTVQKKILINILNKKNKQT